LSAGVEQERRITDWLRVVAHCKQLEAINTTPTTMRRVLDARDVRRVGRKGIPKD
jgi:hypothetical protein